MHVIVLSKKKVIAGAVIGVLLIAGIVIGVVMLTKGEAAPSSVPTMATVENYELQMIPYTAKEVPVYSVSREDKAIALTIDAAWDADKTEKILDILDQYNVRATFFLCGVWVKAYPDTVQAIASRGHVIGNHSMTHPHMSRLTEQEIEKEIVELDEAVAALTGTHTTLFRAPFGEYNDLVILSHNNGYHIETYLPKLIEKAQADGYTFVTVPELLPEGERKVDANGVCRGK